MSSWFALLSTTFIDTFSCSIPSSEKRLHEQLCNLYHIPSPELPKPKTHSWICTSRTTSIDNFSCRRLHELLIEYPIPYTWKRLHEHLYTLYLYLLLLTKVASMNICLHLLFYPSLNAYVLDFVQVLVSWPLLQFSLTTTLGFRVNNNDASTPLFSIIGWTC